MYWLALDGAEMTSRKIGRNELCWCRSGKKYKNCHYERDHAPHKQPWEIQEEFRKQRSDKRYCMHALADPSVCSGQIVKAHTIPKRAALTAIAEQGRVYGLASDFMSIFKNRGKPTFKKIGTGEASTFTGFCAEHDDHTFAPLEKSSVVPTDEQCFLMGYRALCREFFAKELMFEGIAIVRNLDQGTPIEVQATTQWIANLAELGSFKGLAQLQRHKTLHDKMLTERAWHLYRRWVVHFDSVPDVLASGAFCPEFDFRGQRLQHLVDAKSLGYMAITILPAGTGGVAVLGWERESDPVCIPFVESLAVFSKERLANAIVRLVFEYIENTFSRPSWWESLSHQTVEMLSRRMSSGATGLRKPESLTEDNFDYANWPVSSIEKHIPSVAG